MWTTQLCFEPLDPVERLARFNARLGTDSGAVVTFTGLARGSDRQGSAVRSLYLQHHPRLTQRSMDEIASAAAERFDLHAIDVVHRAGVIATGEAIVWVAVAAAHRRAAFEAADYLMDRLKTDAMFWKREDGPDGSNWIEPTDRDHLERSRWE